MSRARRALPRRGAPPCPRALPRAHAPLPRDRRARARSLRRRRRRLGGGRPRRRAARPGERAGRRPDRPGLLARASRGPRSRAGAVGARARGAPRASVPVTRRSDPGSRSTRAHVALGRGPALARPGERRGAGDAHRAAPGSGVGRQPGPAARDHAARVPARDGPHGSSISRWRLSPPRTPRTLLDDWLGSDPALAPLRARIEARARGNPLFVEEIVRSLVERGVLRGERGRVRAGRPDRGDRAARDRPGRPRVAHRSARAARQGRAPGRGGGRATTCRRSCCAPWSICPDPSSPRRSSGSRRPSSSRPAGLRVSTPSGIPSRTRWPTAHSFWIAGAGRTPPSRERCSRSTDRRPRRTPRSSPITSRRRGEHLEAARWHERAGRRVARSDPGGWSEALPQGHGASRRSSGVPRDPDARAHLAHRAARDRPHRGHRGARGPGPLRGGARGRRATGRSARATRSCSRPTDACAGSRATWRSTSPVRSAPSSSPRDPTTRCSRSRCARCWRTRSSRSAASIPRGPSPSEPWPSSPGSPGCGRRSGVPPHPAFCRIWWALASAYLGHAADAQAGLEALLAEEEDGALHALYGTHGFLCEVLRLRGDLARRARSRPPCRRAGGRARKPVLPGRGRRVSRRRRARGRRRRRRHERARAALALARTRRTALWYEPRILATLADAKRAAGDRSGARALLAEARETVERGRGWRLSACDVELARVRLLASEPVPDRTAIERALESVDALAAELGSDPYRRMAEVERARLARAVSAAARSTGSSSGGGRD